MVTQKSALVNENICLKKYIFKFVNAVDLNKCLKKINLPIFLYNCAPISELPCNINTMHLVLFVINIMEGTWLIVFLLKEYTNDVIPRNINDFVLYIYIFFFFI